MLLLITLLLWSQPVVRHLRYPSIDHAPRAYQPRDMTAAKSGTYFVLVGQNKAFCVVTAKEYASVVDGERFDCNWQMPRN